MRVLFTSVYPHLPDVIGGLQTTTDDLCAALVKMGAHAAVLCGQSEHGDLNHSCARCDTALGYPVFRTANPVQDIALVAASWEPDVIVVQSGTTLLPMVISALETGKPTVVYLHNVETHQLGGTLVPDPSILYLANSEFTAQRWRVLCGLQCVVVPPLVLPERYVAASGGDSVLFVNPTQIKGVEIMFALAAACPDIPFLVSESWGLNPKWRDFCLQRARGLPNITWNAPTHDMRAMYAQTRTLLMPSLWEESYGRTVVEAHINGIPVVASNRGALPEVVAAGGVLVDAHANLAEWELALRQAYMPSLVYNQLTLLARQQAYRTAAAPVILGRFVNAIAAHSATCNEGGLFSGVN